MKASTSSIEFSAEELAEIKRRQRESAKLIARLAATHSLEDQERLAGELWPRFDDWVRGRNRIKSTPQRQPRVVAVIAPRAGQRAREHRPGATRRTSSSSSTSSSDPGDPDPPALPGLGREACRACGRVLLWVDGRLRCCNAFCTGEARR